MVSIEQNCSMEAELKADIRILNRYEWRGWYGSESGDEKEEFRDFQ